MDLDKLKTIDDLRNLGITYTPASQKDYTVQELFEIRDLIQSMIDKMPEDQRQVSPWYYGLSPKSGPTDFDKLVNLRGDLINALEDRRRNTAFWFKDDSIDPYGPNPFAEKRSDDKSGKLDTGDQADELPEEDHFGEEQAEGLDNLLEGLKDTPHDNRW